MSLVQAVARPQRDAASGGLDDLRRVERLDRSHLSVVPDEPQRVASATSGWAARLALRVARSERTER